MFDDGPIYTCHNPTHIKSYWGIMDWLKVDPPILLHIMGDQVLDNGRRSICWKGFNI
jgi:hypothetical protein